MKRRDVIKYTALLTGAAVSLPVITSLSSCNSDSVGAASDLSFFNQKEFDFLTKIVDTILPKTDSPSASELGVHQMIDNMVGNVYTSEDQELYRKQFSAFLANTGNKTGNDLSDHLKSLETGANSEAKSGYTHIKQQTIAYYLNTSEIGTKFLNYLPIPGAFEPCITLESVGGKKWAI